MDFLSVLVEREAAIATAIVGALLATGASLPALRSRAGPAAVSMIARAGYALTGASMLLMIAAGFASGR